MYNELIKPKSFIATNGYIFNSPDSVEHNVQAIAEGKAVKIITVTDERTGFRDIIETTIVINGSYGIGDKDEANITILEDGKAVAEANAEKYRQEAEEEARKQAEAEQAETPEEDAVEEVQQETL